MMNAFRFIGDQVHLLAIYILLIKIWKLKSVADISMRSQLLYLMVYVSRYVDIFFYFISIYNTGLKIVFIGTTLTTIVLMATTHRITYNRENDSFRHEILIVACWILAAFINHDNDWMEILWTFSIYLEAVAIVPQLYLLYKIGEIEKVTGLYLLALGSYRGFYILNWVYRYHLEDYFDPIAVAAGVVQTFIYCVFLWIYVMKMRFLSKLASLEKNSALSNIHNCPEAGLVIPQSSQCIQPWKAAGKTKDEISEESERAARKLEECLNESNGYYSAVYCMDVAAAATTIATATPANEINIKENHLDDDECVLKDAAVAHDANGAKK